LVEITMGIQESTWEITPRSGAAGRGRDASSSSAAAAAAAAADGLSPLALRVRGEYREMPGLRLTIRQAARLFGIAPDVAGAVLDELRHLSVLARSDDGTFALQREP
jgi:hypothetical protein